MTVINASEQSSALCCLRMKPIEETSIVLIRRFQKLSALFGFRFIHQTSCAVKIERELACGKEQLIRMGHSQFVTRNRQQHARPEAKIRIFKL